MRALRVLMVSGVEDSEYLGVRGIRIKGVQRWQNNISMALNPALIW